MGTYADTYFQNSEKKQKVEFVNTNNLKLRQNRLRKEFSWKDLQPLMKSLKLFGFFQPLQINENNEVILGSRRLEAAKMAFIDKVPVMKTEANDYEAIQRELFSDLSSKNLSLREKAEAFRQILNMTGMTKYALANYLSLSHTSVCKTLSILKANKETIKLMEEGEISEKKVAMVLYRLKDKSKENYVVNEIIKRKMDIIQAGNFVAEVNNPEIFKKHFLTRLKAFETSIKNFRKRAKEINLGEKDRIEVKRTLESIKKVIDKEYKNI